MAGVLVKDQAQADAEDVRAAYVGDSFPVDIEGIALALGLTVRYMPLDDDISGMLKVDPSEPPTAFINDDEIPTRQRFTLAHEVGHYYERTTRGADDFNFIDRRGGPYDIHEFYADEFAGNLLMPRAEVERLTNQGIGPAGLAKHFGVSLGAMQKRLERLEKHG